MRHPRAMGRRLSARQAAIDAARRIKESTKTRRFVGKVTNVTDRETTGTVECTGPMSPFAVTVQVRMNVDLAADDYIWIKEDQGAQGTYVFDGFLKGGGTGNNAASAPIPWTQSPGVTSPAGSGLTVQAPSGETTTIGRAGDTTSFPGTISGISLNELDDVNAGAPSDNDALTWDTGTSKWINEALSAGWPFTGEYLSVSTSDADAEYSTIAGAIAAASAGDTILLSSESIGCVNQTLPDGVHLGCLGPSAAILTNSTNAITLNVGNNSVVFNIEVRNTYAVAAVYAVYMPTNTDTARFYNVTATPDNSGGAGNAYAFYIGGSSELVDCRGITNAASYGYGFVGIGAGDKRIQGGYFDGSGSSGGNDINTQAGTTTLIDPVLENDLVDTLVGGTGTRGGWYATDGEHRDDTQKITNTSGGTVAAGALGYIDSAGEFKTTTTAYSDVSWAVVLVGGANNANVWVARKGVRTVTLNGNCSAGNYLYTSTTAGQAQPQSYVRPEVCAVALTANAGGAGGTCSALLLTDTVPVPLALDDSVYQINATAGGSDSDWNGTIDSLPGGAAVRYDHVSGDERNLRPEASTQYGKLRLYNSAADPGEEYALISDNDPTGGAGYDGEITLTANVPASWAATDAITIRSQTNTSTVGSSYFLDLELTGTDIPALTRILEMEWKVKDTGAGDEKFKIHPWEANDNAKRVSNQSQVANQEVPISGVKIKVIQNRFCVLWSGSGAGTARFELKPVVAHVAAP